MYNPMLTPQQQMQQIEQRMAMTPGFNPGMLQPMQPMQSMQPMASRDPGGITWVNGFEGAKAALIPLGTPVLLMDSTDSKFYIKQINDQGTPVIQAYRFHPLEARDSAQSTPQEAPTRNETTPKTDNHNEGLFLQKLQKIEERLARLETTKGGNKNGQSA